ncbi:MAG TPA: TolC family protein [Polyangiaceae bacterium]
MLFGGRVILVLVLAVTSVRVASAGDAPRVTARAARTLTLQRCLELAEWNYPKVRQALARLEKKRAQLDEAHTAPFSRFSATAGAGLAPTVRGTNVFSPNSDVSLSSNMAFAWQFGVQGVVPLWTFGKIESLWDAAEAQVGVGEHEVKKERNDVRLAVREAYYGAQLAHDSAYLVQSALKRLGTYIANLEQGVRDGSGDDIELVKVKMYSAELEARESEALRQHRIALLGLRFLTGVKGEVALPDEPLRRLPHSLGPVERYLAAARLFRPEINMARAGVLARSAQLGLSRARHFPDFGLALSASFTRAPEVTDQRNPFVRDPGNVSSYGAGLVLHWELDFLPQAARVAQARAELEEMRATERLALGGVAVEVEKAFAQARDADRRLDALSRATELAKQWLIKVQQGIDVGTMEDEDLVDPTKEYALKRFARMSAVYDYNLAMAKLAQVTGWDAVLAGE